MLTVKNSAQNIRHDVTKLALVRHALRVSVSSMKKKGGNRYLACPATPSFDMYIHFPIDVSVSFCSTKRDWACPYIDPSFLFFFLLSLPPCGIYNVMCLFLFLFL